MTKQNVLTVSTVMFFKGNPVKGPVPLALVQDVGAGAAVEVGV